MATPSWTKCGPKWRGLCVADALTGMADDLAVIYTPESALTHWRLIAERTALRNRLAYLDSIKANCKACEHWGGKMCDLFNEAPPAEFQTADGQCESWVHDGVPF